DRNELVAPVAVEIERQETRGPRLAGVELEPRAQHEGGFCRSRGSVSARRGERERADDGQAREAERRVDHAPIVSRWTPRVNARGGRRRRGHRASARGAGWGARARRAMLAARGSVGTPVVSAK